MTTQHTFTYALIIVNLIIGGLIIYNCIGLQKAKPGNKYFHQITLLEINNGAYNLHGVQLTTKNKVADYSAFQEAIDKQFKAGTKVTLISHNVYLNK